MPSGGWEQHLSDVARCRGGACFKALARHFQTESSNQLERRLDGRKPYRLAHGERAWSGKYRQWLKGAQPSDDTHLYALAVTNGGVNLKFWRDLPLWKVLERPLPTISDLQDEMARMPDQIRRMVFVDTEWHRSARFSRRDFSQDSMLALRNLGSLNAFQTLLFIACEGEALNDDLRHVVPSMCAYDLFPRIVVKYPELHFRWELLYDCLERIFWKRIYFDGSVLRCSKLEIARRIDMITHEPFAKYELLAGHRPPKISGLQPRL